VSKHSYRRLAIVAGTALAVGSMAPAMAAHVDAGSNGSATVDISGGTAPTVPTILPAGFLSSLTDTALVTAQSAPGMALSDVNTIAGDLLGIGGDILASGLPAVDVNAGANASSGGSAGGNGSVSVTIPTDVLGTATGAPGILAGDALGAAAPVVNTATTVANTGLAAASTLPSSLLGTSGTLLNGGVLLPSLTGNVNVLASLMGSM